MEKPLDIPRALETERLFLRCPLADDSPAINAGIRASWQELGPWMEWAQGEPPSVDDTHGRMSIREKGFEDRADFTYGAFEKDSGEFVGMFSLFRFDWNVPSGEIGYWVATPKTGRGYATEVTEALTQYGFSLGLVRVQIRCDANNRRSKAVAERAGYALEGTLRNECLTPQGELRDTCVYSRLPESV